LSLPGVFVSPPRRYILNCEMCADDPEAARLIEVEAETAAFGAYLHCIDVHLQAYLRDTAIAEDLIRVFR
jgi:hypothetical protein